MKLDFLQKLDELKQQKEITEILINKILYSKRLLVDHVESLEHCMTLMQSEISSMGKSGECKSREIFTARNTCMLLGTSLLEHIFTPKSLKLTLIPSVVLTGGFSALYMVKNIFVFRNKIVERELDNFIRTVDEFSNCIRRNMTYFNEIIMMKTAELIESRQCERAWDCITSAKEVTEILYDATRKLESQYPLPVKFSEYYSPMEELRECEYFKTNVTDYSPKNIKDFHNIFIYVQSQFLLRLALTISQNPSVSEINTEIVKIDCQIKQLVLEEENHFKNLAIDLNRKKPLEIDELNTTKTMQNKSGPAAVLQDSSLKLSACMVAVAAECTQLDIVLQRLTITESFQKDNSQNLIEVANSMRSIENTLSICFDDFRRLMLVYNKFLSSKLDNKIVECDDKRPLDDNSVDSEFPESILRVEISNNEEKKDDFYAYMFDEKQSQTENTEDDDSSSSRRQDSEILIFEKRVTRGKFKPVLNQLKNRIDPIRQEMLEKERKVLAAKGINIDELFEKENNNHIKSLEENCMDAHNDNDSEGSADEIEQHSKKIKERDNFAEVRNFLAQKQAINLFQLGVLEPPQQGTMGEDILE